MKTPKEKARELYENYLELVPIGFIKQYKFKAVKASLLCVREILESIPLVNGTDRDIIYRSYYIEVDYELRQL